VHDELDALLTSVILGQGSLTEFHTRTGFVDQVNGLVRQESDRAGSDWSGNRKRDGVVGIVNGVNFS